MEFYKKWLPKDKEANILELCCGTGRLTIPIAKEGYNITGVDYTASMLNQAIAKANKEQLSIDFVQEDIRTLDLGKRFDFIFIPFNSIHHLYKNEDLFKVLKIVKKHLQENGIFLLVVSILISGTLFIKKKRKIQWLNIPPATDGKS